MTTFKKFTAFVDVPCEWVSSTYSCEQEVKRLNAENAKLRELVRFIMHRCNDGNPRCDECIEWNYSECVSLQRMRELGIEVEG